MSDSIPNPPNASRRHRMHRRYRDESIWRGFFEACASSGKFTAIEAAGFADKAYTEYRLRFPLREPELDDEPAADDEAQGARPQ